MRLRIILALGQEHPMDAHFKITLFDQNPAVVAAMREAFKGFLDVETIQCPLAGLPAHDCLVSPANSFGKMDGGIDAAIVALYGQGLEAAVQAAIAERWRGQQPVGTSMLVPTGASAPLAAWLAHTPTMRVPMPIAGTDAVYRAFYAMLTAVHQHNMGAWESWATGHTGSPVAKIESVACPGLGTATGRVSPQSAAAQMRLAYFHWRDHGPQIPAWLHAQQMQDEIEAAVHAAG